MTISRYDLERYADHECPDEIAQEIEEAVQRDPQLAGQLEHIVRLNEALHSQVEQIQAPEHLRRSVTEQFGRTEPDSADRLRSQQRRWWVMGSVGAMAAAAAGVSIVPLLRQQPISDVAKTFFRDFETYLLKDRTVDLIETDSLRIAQWYESRLPFKLPPVSSSGNGAQLVGARLCWLLERRLASLSYETKDGPIVLYVTKADGLALPVGADDDRIGQNISWHRTSNYTGLIWQSDDLLMAMISTQALYKLKKIARSITA